MSRGPGRAQRFALAYLADHPGSTARELARAYLPVAVRAQGARASHTPAGASWSTEADLSSAGSSMDRALRGLVGRGLVVRRELVTEDYRWGLERQYRRWTYSLPSRPSVPRVTLT